MLSLSTRKAFAGLYFVVFIGIHIQVGNACDPDTGHGCQDHYDYYNDHHDEHHDESDDGHPGEPGMLEVLLGEVINDETAPVMQAVGETMEMLQQVHMEFTMHGLNLTDNEQYGNQDEQIAYVAGQGMQVYGSMINVLEAIPNIIDQIVDHHTTSVVDMVYNIGNEIGGVLVNIFKEIFGFHFHAGDDQDAEDDHDQRHGRLGGQGDSQLSTIEDRFFTIQQRMSDWMRAEGSDESIDESAQNSRERPTCSGPNNGFESMQDYASDDKEFAKQANAFYTAIMAALLMFAVKQGIDIFNIITVARS